MGDTTVEVANGLLGVAIVLVLGLPGSADAMLPQPASPSTQVHSMTSRSEAEAAVGQQAVDYYVKTYGVSPEEARRRLATQTMVPNLQSLLEEQLGTHLTSLWFDNTDGRWVLDTNGAIDGASLQALMASAGLGDAYRTKQVSYDRRALETHLARAADGLKSGLQSGHVRVGLAGDKLAVTLAHAATPDEHASVDSVAAEARKTVPVSVESSDLKTLAAAPTITCTFPYCDNLVGGQRWWRDLGGGYVGTCTLAFGGVISSDQLHSYSLTAGHCIDNPPGSAVHTCPSPLPGYNCLDGGVTAALVYGAGNGDAGLIRDYTQNYPIYAGYVDWNSGGVSPLHNYTVSWEPTYVVDCHTGITTKTSCGTVVLSQTPVWYGTVYAGMMTAVTGACNMEGDSGGPWDRSNYETGVGINSGRSPAWDPNNPLYCGSSLTSLFEPVFRSLGDFGMTLYTIP